MYIDELADSNLPQRLLKLTKELLAGVAEQQQLELQPSENLFAGAEPGWCFQIIGGGVQVEFNGQHAYFLEPGDFVAPSELYGAGVTPVFKNTSPVTLDIYAWEDILTGLRNDLARMNTWLQLQATTQSLLLHALTQSSSALETVATEQLEFAPGGIIIKQGEIPTHVYKLLAGHAEAFQQDIKVGDIHAGEIFGSIAVFTEQRRTATVIAEQPCRVTAIRQEQFVDMLRVQPDLCRAMLEKMARKIVDLNDAILALEPEEA